MGQIFIEASDTRPSSLANHEIVKPSTPAKELATPSLLLSASRFSRGDEAPSSQDSSSQHLSTDENVISIPPPVHHTCPDDGLAIEEATVVGATKKAIEAQRLTERYHARCKRNITLQKLAVTAGLVAVKYVNKVDSASLVEKQTYKAQFHIHFCVLVVGKVLLCLPAVHLSPFGTQLYHDCVNRTL
jgi:hypothetical protein